MAKSIGAWTLSFLSILKDPQYFLFLSGRIEIAQKELVVEKRHFHRCEHRVKALKGLNTFLFLSLHLFICSALPHLQRVFSCFSKFSPPRHGHTGK
jgi:hypothetical protein